MSEAHDLRLDRLEADVGEIKTILRDLVPLIIRIDQRLTSELPQLTTKAELSDTRAEIYKALLTHTLVIIGTMIAGLSLLFTALHFWPPHA